MSIYLNSNYLIICEVSNIWRTSCFIILQCIEPKIKVIRYKKRCQTSLIYRKTRQFDCVASKNCIAQKEEAIRMATEIRCSCRRIKFTKKLSRTEHRFGVHCLNLTKPGHKLYAPLIFLEFLRPLSKLQTTKE